MPTSFQARANGLLRSSEESSDMRTHVGPWTSLLASLELRLGLDCSVLCAEKVKSMRLLVIDNVGLTDLCDGKIWSDQALVCESEWTTAVWVHLGCETSCCRQNEQKSHAENDGCSEAKNRGFRSRSRREIRARI